MSKPRLIAFYLPQFYPTPENDEWWGKGFTEWTNVGKAKPLFKGHNQPKVPADLGYYDLRLPIIREQQAQMAKDAGIEGFCYWHYWTNGKRMLSQVFDEVVCNKTPDYPFCLCWANHNWYKKTWSEKGKDVLLIKQEYRGVEDYTNHFNVMLPAFKDPRYMKVNGKLIFGIFLPYDLPNPKQFFDTWNELAVKNGLEGFFFFAYCNQRTKTDSYLKMGFDCVVLNLDWEYMFRKGDILRGLNKLKRNYLNIPNLIPYKKYVEICKEDFNDDPAVIPCLEPNFDHSPRSGTKGLIFKNSTPKYWEELCTDTFQTRAALPENENVVFIKAWNEWGEGNYLEPDLQFGRGYLQALKMAYLSIQ